MWIIKGKGSGTRKMKKCAWVERNGEMHTLIERPSGQRKYLRENENFISGILRSYKTRTIHKKRITGKAQLEKKGFLFEGPGGYKSKISTQLFIFSLLLLSVSWCHYYFILLNGKSEVASGPWTRLNAQMKLFVFCSELETNKKGQSASVRLVKLKRVVVSVVI